MRGKPSGGGADDRTVRITPAGAGKTSQGYQYQKQLEDHPRRCGENAKLQDTRGQLRGSPPQVRGKPSCVSGAGTISGITPAGAGKTYRFDFVVFNAQDHPRRCGENYTMPHKRLQPTGSPPQVRGKQQPQPLTRWTKRITPAGAGKTFAPGCTYSCR